MTTASPGLAAAASRSKFADPEPEADPPSPATRAETWGEKVYGALPLFVVGALCLGVAVDLYFVGPTAQIAGVSSARLSPWVLFLALGITGVAAGVFALFVEDEPSTPAGAPTESPSSAASAPAWDESTIAPEKPGYIHPRTWEQYPELPTEVGWTRVEPRVGAVPPDVVLVQIDEIAASLKKRPPPRNPPP